MYILSELPFLIQDLGFPNNFKFIIDFSGDSFPGL